MKTRLVLTTLFLLSGGSAFAGESNNLASVEVPAGTGVYHTMSLASRTAEVETGKPSPRFAEVSGGTSRVSFPATPVAAARTVFVSR